MRSVRNVPRRERYIQSSAPAPEWHPYCGEALPAGVRDVDACDIDSNDQRTHLKEARFAVEIHRNMLARETPFMAHRDYMDKQEDITVKMRAILIDWLVDVHLKFKLQPETLFLTVNIIDRFLEVQPVVRRKLQLVGVTAMLIASKYEEIYAPVCRDFVYISDKAYSEDEILKMEAVILNKLNFNLTVPSAHCFLQRALKVARFVEGRSATGRGRSDDIVGHLAHYTVELAMQDATMLAYRPSVIAAAATRLAARLVHGAPATRWCRTKQFHSGGITASTLAPCERALARLLVNENDTSRKLNAIKRKYAGPAYGEISTLVATLDVEQCELIFDHTSMDVVCGED